ncbi:MAG TPA: T9SS type A sorting domain-containing protein [Saprospiraceae bacterium]|nr:T9SS type A sorting domain-containing protein [Saprospiraceae bacterium]
MLLSPNPVANGEVDLNVFDKNQSEYRIVNLQGQTVANGTLKIGDNTIKLINIPKGEYIIQIKNGKAMRFMVQ